MKSALLLLAFSCSSTPDTDKGATPTETGALPKDTSPPADSVGAQDSTPDVETSGVDTGPTPHTGGEGEGEGEGETSGEGEGEGETGGEGEGEGEGEPMEPVRFVALGDAGEGNDMQYQVAAAIETVCAASGCDFALYLGDNFYNDGVDGTDDELWETAFELPYAYLDFEFRAVLGNHDYGGEGAGYEYWKADYQVEYSDISDKWYMPDNYYSFTEGPADFFGLDTNLIFWGFGDDHLAWLAEQTAASTAPWRVVYGHHTYISNGQHGNAGNYEGLSWLPIVNGASVEEFIEEGVCGVAHVYICGHDHNRQWLEPTCGTEFIVSGAGAKDTELEHREDNPTYFEAETEGFLWVEITETTFTGVFYDAYGVEEYRRELSL